MGSQQDSTSSRDKSRCHCQWPLSLPQPYNCYPHSKRLVWSCAGSFPVCWSWWTPISSGKLFQWVSPSWSWPLCSYSHSSHSSSGLGELSPVLQCGSLSLFPSVAGWRFYSDIYDIHQSDDRARPIRAPSPLLLRALAGVILVHFWEFLYCKVSC